MDEKAPLPSSPSAHPHPRPSPLPAFSTALKRITLSPTTLLLLPILLLASRLPQTALYIYRTRTAYYTHAPSFHSIATLASPNPDTSFLLNDAAAARAAGSIASDVLTVLLAGAHWGINMLVVVYDIDVREPFPETWRWLVFGSLGWSAVLDGWAGWGAVRAMGVEGCVVAWRKRKGGWVYECGVEAAVCGLPGVWPEQIDGERLEGACWEAKFIRQTVLSNMVCALVLLVAFGIQEWRRDRAFKADQMAADANAEKGQGERRVVKREPPQIEMPAWRVWALAFCIAYHVIYWIVDNFF